MFPGVDIVVALLSKIAISFLETMLARHDLKQSVRNEIAANVQALSLKAAQWAAAHPDPGGLRDAGGDAPLPNANSFKPSK